MYIPVHRTKGKEGCSPNHRGRHLGWRIARNMLPSGLLSAMDSRALEAQIHPTPNSTADPLQTDKQTPFSRCFQGGVVSKLLIYSNFASYEVPKIPSRTFSDALRL